VFIIISYAEIVDFSPASISQLFRLGLLDFQHHLETGFSTAERKLHGAACLDLKKITITMRIPEEVHSTTSELRISCPSGAVQSNCDLQSRYNLKASSGSRRELLGSTDYRIRQVKRHISYHGHPWLTAAPGKRSTGMKITRTIPQVSAARS
jgi:hypothetical protein